MGSTLSVYLAAAKPATVPDAEREPAASEISGGRILVMDDHPDVQRTASAMVRACGFAVDLVSDGSAAVSAVASELEDGHPYTAVILDLTVPGGLGGAEIIGRLLEIQPGLKAIVSSGYSESPVLSDYRGHGFAGVLPKPYRIAELRRTLRDVLGLSVAGETVTRA